MTHRLYKFGNPPLPAKYDRILPTYWMSGAVISAEMWANNGNKQPVVNADTIIAAHASAARKAKLQGNLIVIDRESIRDLGLQDDKLELLTKCVDAVHAIAPDIKKIISGGAPLPAFSREYMVGFALGKPVKEMPPLLDSFRPVLTKADYVMMGSYMPGESDTQLGLDLVLYGPRILRKAYPQLPVIQAAWGLNDQNKAMAPATLKRYVAALKRNDYHVIVFDPQPGEFLDALIAERTPQREPSRP